MKAPRRALALALLLTTLGCQALPGQSPAMDPPDERPTISPTVSATVEPAETLSPEVELQRVMDVRMDWGLRSDEEWVRQLAADPAALASPLGIPVTRQELAELEEMIAQDPTTALIMYGARNHDQFGGLWVNEPGVGTVMLFTGELARHRQAIARLPGGERVEVRPARFSQAELLRLQRQLAQELLPLPGAEPVSLGLDTRENVLVYEVKSNDAGLKERLEAQYGGRLRVEQHPMPGQWQHATDGPGWRLLAVGVARDGSLAYSTDYALDEDAYLDLWATLDPVNEAPEVDFADEIVATFAEGIGSTCAEVRLDEVVIDHAASRVYGVLSDPLQPRTCTADLVGAAYFVVALDRAALPAGRFTIGLRRACEHCEEQVVELP